MSRISFLLVVFFMNAGLTMPAFAEKPDKAPKSEKGGKGANHQGNASGSGGISVNVYFDDRDRDVIREYYGQEFRAGNCPPGLAKKNNGCLPPGQAKKWRIGHPLPGDVVFYDLPSSVIVRIGPPPSGYKYVRVAADVLMIAVGTGMVVDAIEDLSRM